MDQLTGQMLVINYWCNMSSRDNIRTKLSICLKKTVVVNKQELISLRYKQILG